MSGSSRSPLQGRVTKRLGLWLLALCFVPVASSAAGEVSAAYDQAMSAYKAGSYTQALKDLDQLETLKLTPSDRAESLNLRGVILMRTADYEMAEKMLQNALHLAPSLANAKYNLAQISFLKRDSAEARKRFEQMLADDHAGVENNVGQLIRFKIFLTLLLDRKESEAAKLMDQWQPTSPAAYYAHVATEKNHAHESEAKRWQQAARTKFGEATDKLYVESFYELGWDERPASQPPENFEISTAAERERGLEKGAGDVLAKAEETTYAESLESVTLLPVSLAKYTPENEGAPEMLRLPLSIIQDNSLETEIPFRRSSTDLPMFFEADGGNHSKRSISNQEAVEARGKLEKLFAAADNPRSKQFILYKVFLTFILESSDYQAGLLMQRFSYTDEIPALYYANGAWAFQHGDSTAGNDWIELAMSIYSAELNALFLDDFYRLHWLNPDLDQVSSNRISLGTPLSNTLPVQPPPTTLMTTATASTPDPKSQFLTRTGRSEVPSH